MTFGLTDVGGRAVPLGSGIMSGSVWAVCFQTDFGVSSTWAVCSGVVDDDWLFFQKKMPPPITAAAITSTIKRKPVRGPSAGGGPRSQKFLVLNFRS